jgi:hypothetical protein
MTDYMLGVRRIEKWLKIQGDDLSPDKYLTFINLKTALIESIEDEQKLGGLIGPIEKTERRRILSGLNKLALRFMGISFIDLSQPEYDFEIQDCNSIDRGEQDEKRKNTENIQIFVISENQFTGVDQRNQQVHGLQTNIAGDAKGPIASGEFNSGTIFGEGDAKDDRQSTASEKHNEGG